MMKLRTNIRRRIWSTASERAAQALYEQAQHDEGTTIALLGQSRSRLDRSVHLTALARHARNVAQAASIVDPDHRCSAGFSPVDWASAAADIYDLLASAEMQPVSGTPWRTYAAREDYTLGQNPTVAAILDRFIDAHGPAEKANLLVELYTAVELVIGSQAAEVVDALARAYQASSALDREAMPKPEWNE